MKCVIIFIICIEKPVSLGKRYGVAEKRDSQSEQITYLYVDYYNYFQLYNYVYLIIIQCPVECLQKTLNNFQKSQKSCIFAK